MSMIKGSSSVWMNEAMIRLRPQKYGGFAMRNVQGTRRTFAAAPRAILALTMALCLLFSMLPTAWAATSVGSKADSLTPSSSKVYVKLSKSVYFFTGETYGNGSLVIPAIGTVCQLVTDNYYTASDGLEYYGVYYMNTRYNALRSDIVGDIMTDSQLETYITGILWKQPTYTTLKKAMNLVGDVRVHALQLALSRLNYYSGGIDGNYGDKTVEAVKKFQRANGLDADGSAGVLTQPVIYALASGSAVPPAGGGSTGGGSTGGSESGSTGPTAPSSGSLKTNVSVNLRKRATTSAARLAVVPKGVTLNYTDTYTKNGVTWFEVNYNSLTGWLMGTFVSAGANASSPTIGSVTITKPGTRVRKTADGVKTGTVLAKGTVVSLLAQPVSAGGYTWYNIRTGSGLIGFVRGDCATLTGEGGGGSTGGGSTGPLPAPEQSWVRLPANTTLFTGKTQSGGMTVSAGTVLQLVGTYTEGGTEYCTVYYNNSRYNAVYANVKVGLMSADELNAYVKTLWASPLNSSLKRELNLVGDVRVYALQVGLNVLGYYTGKLDGNYGSGTQSAVRNFQRNAKISVDGACGKQTWNALAAQINGGSTGGGNGGNNNGGGIVVTDFGVVNSVQKGTWDYGDNGGAMFPKNSYATVMDVATGKVFRIFRWSGGNHADCVPASANDTRIMCDIVGFPYNSNHPNSSQLSQIKADGNNSVVKHTWPDFKNAFGGAKDIGSAWDRRPALLNVDGKVYSVSIYGFPHGFTGSDSFSRSTFPNGQLFYAANNYYGMMCVHFTGSKTHGGSAPDEKHQANITTAYNYAKKLWPTLVK